jgi:5,10-methylenetetrahydrofolate reductase
MNAASPCDYTASMTLDRLKHHFESNRDGVGGRPVICLEVNPPRGVDLDPIFTRLEGHIDGLDFFNVTDSALARMKCASLPFAAMLKQRFGVEPLVNLSCRDRNVIALQGELLAAWMMGVRSIVALTGDAVSIGDLPSAKGVFEVNSVGLLQIVEKLNSGYDLAGNELKGAPHFWPGAVVNPNAKNAAAELKRLARKVDSGARYALSQPVFDEEAALEFFQKAQDIPIPILVGLLPFRNAQAARNLLNVPGIKLSESIHRVLDSSESRDLSDFSIDHCLSLAKLLRPLVAGFHVISGVTPKLGLRLVGALGTEMRPHAVA